jgi:hypothetical protein
MVMSPNVSKGTKRIAPPNPPRDPTVEVTNANAMINTSWMGSDTAASL